MKIPIERGSLESLLETLCHAENSMNYANAISGIQEAIQELSTILALADKPIKETKKDIREDV